MLSCKKITLENHIFTILKDVDFTALTGSITILNGPNGCGKTSLLKTILGLSNPSSGQVLWNETDIKTDIQIFHKNVSYIGHKNALKPGLTVLENLKFWANFKGEKELLEPAISFFNLDRFTDIQVGALSSGLQRRVELSKLLLSPSSLWILDEPEIGLDKENLEKFKGLLKIKARNDGVIIIASHTLKIEGANYINLLDFKNAEMDLVE